MENPKDRQFNMMMTESDYARLKSRAIEEDLPAAAVVRKAIKSYLSFYDGQMPLCADGSACVAPALHPRVQGQQARATAGMGLPHAAPGMGVVMEGGAG